MPLSPGTRLGTYVILGPLGAGGMGEVYRAKDPRLGREVAVKVLPAEVASSPDRLARLEREARTVAGLNHPNIVTLHSVEDADGVRFLTMELVEGQTLSTLVTPGGLPVTRLLEIAISLTDGLVAAHERGVIHRDLKPGNVMVTHDGRVKILDFGLAKMMAVDASPQDAAIAVTAAGSISGEGQVVGTLPYMAPEQLRGETVDPRGDLFSLGAILFELATGGRAFPGRTPAEVSTSILRDAPGPLARVRADLPVDFERIVSRCLEKTPRERAQSALDVNNELRRLRRILEHGGGEKLPSKKTASIAVLPFANRSASAADEYFSDGLADELLTVLSKIRGLRVTARTSSFHFKGKDTTIGEIGRALDVATVLEGSVRKAGDRIRVSVQLVSVSDSSNLWSETYERTLQDIFSVQDDIAQSVVKKLRTTLLGEEGDSDASAAAKAEVAEAARGRGTNPEAQRLYILARHLIDRWNREDTAKAIGYLKEALAQDPAYAHAWAELGRAYTDEALQGWAPVVVGFGRAREAVERALALEPNLAEAHARMGWIRQAYDWDSPGAESSFARALELSPGNAAVLRGASSLAQDHGRIEQAIDLLRQALEQDPLSAPTYHNLGTVLHSAHRFEEAEAAYGKCLELVPHCRGTHACLSVTLLALDRGKEALAEVLQETDEAFRLWAQAIVHHGLGSQAESDAALQELVEKYAMAMAYEVAAVYGLREEVKPAFEWLERAYERRHGGLLGMKCDPRLRCLHGDPRWGVFLKKMGLEE